MIIYFVNQFALKPSLAGGTRHFSLAREFVAEGHEVYIIASNVHYSTRAKFSITNSHEIIDGVNFIWLETSPYKGNIQRFLNHLCFAAKTAMFLWRNKKPQADVIIASSPHPFAAFVAWVFSRIKHIKFAYEIRDLWPESLIDLGSIGPKHPLALVMYKIERYLVERSAFVAYLMPNAPLYFKMKGLLPRATIWIPNGIDLSLTKYEMQDAPKATEVFKILYLGSHGVADGLDLIVDTAVKLKDHPGIQFHLVGDGPQKRGLEDRVQQLQLQNIVFRSSVPKTEVGALLSHSQAAIVLAMPSPLYRWGISFNKIYDYFAAARPILFVGKVARNPVEEAKAGIVVEEFDAEMLAGSVLKLYRSSSEEQALMGTNGLKFVREKHDINTLAKKYLKAIDGVFE